MIPQKELVITIGLETIINDMSLTLLDLRPPHVPRPRDFSHRNLDVSTRLKNEWARQGVKLRPGLSRTGLEAAESKLGVPLPEDLRKYFLLVDGFDGEMDGECICFLSMQDALEATKDWRVPDLASAKLFAFADFLISSHVYMIGLATKECGSNPVYVVYDSKPEWMRKVADNFSDFVNSYVEHDFSVLFPK